MGEPENYLNLLVYDDVTATDPGNEVPGNGRNRSSDFFPANEESEKQQKNFGPSEKKLEAPNRKKVQLR